MSLPEEYVSHPAVCCVGNDYQIMLAVKSDCLMWVEVDGERFYDSSNGILRSACRIHRVTIPACKIDKAGKYTLVTKKVIERKPYFPKFENEVSTEYSFRRLPDKGSVRIHCISDTHNLVDAPIDAYNGSQRADLLVLNGDIPDHSGQVENIVTLYEIAGAITKGEFPTVISRGNHDTRGTCAENLVDFTPNANGKTYFTFRAGCLWGMVLDCAEDKDDSCDEYGGTICCNQFRREETAFIHAVIADKENEYEADGVKQKLVIAHSPFPMMGMCEPPFNIELELFDEWTTLMHDKIKPTLMLFGHKHISEIVKPHSKKDYYDKLPCDIVLSGVPNHKENTHISVSVLLNDDGTYKAEYKTGRG